MQQYIVIFTPEAEEQIAVLYRYIAAAASPEIAERCISAIVTYCEGLRAFPHRGIERDDIRSNLRVTNYKGRAVIAFAVDAGLVSIIGIFYGGQDYETALQTDFDD
jgi:plasmid stabilization system protein ParE